MSFLDKVKTAAGVGAASVQGDVNQRPGKRGDELVGTIRIIPGKTPQKLNYCVVTVEWDGDWSYRNADGAEIQVRGGKGYVLLDKPANAQGVTLQPGSTIELPVRVKIPSDAPITGEKLKWKFYARADIEGAADPEWNTALEIRG
jgi:sporulation-control protein spo0M